MPGIDPDRPGLVNTKVKNSENRAFCRRQPALRKKSRAVSDG
jgi:hypothetical protein